MKRCPNCNQIFSDDNDFCPNDGMPLVVESGEVQSSGSLPTQYIARPQNTQYQTPPVVAASSLKWVFPLIGILCGLVVVFGFLAFFKESPTDKSFVLQTNANAGESDQIAAVGESNKNTETQPSLQAETTPIPPTPPTSTTARISPAGNWSGDWSSSSGAYLTANTTLFDDGDSKVHGDIIWTLKKTATPRKLNKIGYSATEFVRGAFEPGTRKLSLVGYGKNDPNQVLDNLDSYRLVLSETNDQMAGSSSNFGRWNSRFLLKRQ